MSYNIIEHFLSVIPYFIETNLKTYYTILTKMLI